MSRVSARARLLPHLLTFSLIVGISACDASLKFSGDQTINFAAVGSQTVGATVSLSATASSGLPVSFTSLTPSVCTVSGTTATMIAEGTCTIEVEQAGDVEFPPAAMSQSIAVNGKGQTISFANPGTQTMGTSVPTLSVTASSGLPVSLASETAGVCSVSGSTVTLLAWGTCSIEATQAGNSTYASATPVTETFTVDGEPQTINFSGIANQTLSTSPTLPLSATASSGLAVSFASQTTAVCTVSGTMATFLKAGTCSIEAMQAGNTTYAAAEPVTQSFTVNGSSTLLSQTITFNNPGTQTVGTPLALAATASSGLPVSFASQTTAVCTVSGTTATFLTAGTCTIQATQAGNATYAAATPVTQSFTVNASLLSQTITFANPGAQTVGAPLTLVATASSGLVVSFASQTTTVCTVAGTTATFLKAGTCTIQATQAGNATYAAATPVTQSFTVNASSLLSQTITFANPGAQTVGTPLTLVATASSGLAVSFASQTTTVCTVSGTTATFLTAGTCTIQATQAGNATYAAATPVTQSFTVNAGGGTGSSPGAYAVGYSSCPAPAGAGVQYSIGLLDSSGQPSGPQTIAAFTEWNNLNAGDVVCIYGKSTPYAERLVLVNGGSSSAPVRIVGVNQGGYDPVLTGQNATTPAAFNYGAEISEYYEGGEISVTGLNYGAPVAYLNIEGLTIEGATTAEVGGTVANPTFTNNTFSDPNVNGGAQSPWSCGSSGINLIRSDHISIIHNRIKDNDNGIFVESNNGNTSSNVLIEYNHIYGNGVLSGTINSCSFDAHGTYTEADGITYLGNRFGALKQVAGGGVNLLKDRSAGLSVEYNLFEPDGVLEAALGDELLVGSGPGPVGHLLDLVESYDPSVGFNTLGAVYLNVSVFGNILFDDGLTSVSDSEGSQDAIHFGGDEGNPAVFRKYLHYYNNTSVARRSDGVGWLEMETGTNAEVWNNILYAANTGSASDSSGFSLLDTWCYMKGDGGACGTLTYTNENWNSPIWGTTGVNGSTDANPNFADLSSNDVHIAIADPTIVGNGQAGDPAYPANATTIPIEYQDFLTTIARPYSMTNIDLGALGYSATEQ